MSVDHPLSPQEVSHHLKLDHLVKYFHLIGKRGSQIMNSSFSLPHELITDFQIVKRGNEVGGDAEL